MAVLVLAACWLGASVIVARLLESYRNPRSTHFLILVSVFLCWLLPFSLTFLLPMDLSSTRYEYCISRSMDPSQCPKPFLYVDVPVRHASWLGVYWVTFFLTWYCRLLCTHRAGCSCPSCKAL